MVKSAGSDTRAAVPQRAVEQAFVDAFRVLMLVSGALVAAGAVIAGVGVRRQRTESPG